ncbi:tRNA-specific 2-thiouridylase [Sedimentibacter acidaminivorans]|uniref:tRNA-specific 2-thiouridylase MnmA n=1 Tax=Sedimentibacter acidaminivorans TaxID=913099 RepID=A0ABS4GBX9_9FIRM|nr:tRNA 2-thiouridine(34) synthase MnmA [Sedimentibacter acidaminivorans]MBP1925032.1 tRNA-specific 2-thiouridylase [Sedimentibacter acidaminivorans]
MINSKRVAVALSGGVDSGAVAYILKEQGYNVFGITMKLFDEFDVSSSQYVAKMLNIEHYIVDFKEYFENEVIDKFVGEYLEGKTPNPCIMCNIKVKYGLMIEKAKELGADFMAFGHYANIKYDEKDLKFHLYKSDIEKKDQSYFLYHLNQEQLSSVLLPLNGYKNKNEVRELVKKIIPETSGKKDSQDICFITNMSHGKFIKKRCGLINTEGNFVDLDGNFIGKHTGIYNYTIGQKRGLGINNNNSLFVLKINNKTNEIVLGDEKHLYKDEIIVENITYIDENNKRLQSIDCEVKLCQWGYYLKCIVINKGCSKAVVRFEKPERAPAPGQSAVFYIGDEVLGGGIIV